MYVTKRYRFQAARRLTTLPEAHPCGRLHGASFDVVVSVGGELSTEHDWIVDFGDLDSSLEPVLARVDHRFLNEVSGLENPTTERITLWFWRELSPRLPGLRRVEVWESGDAGCVVEAPEQRHRG